MIYFSHNIGAWNIKISKIEENKAVISRKKKAGYRNFIRSQTQWVDTALWAFHEMRPRGKKTEGQTSALAV